MPVSNISVIRHDGGHGVGVGLKVKLNGRTVRHHVELSFVDLPTEDQVEQAAVAGKAVLLDWLLAVIQQDERAREGLRNS